MTRELVALHSLIQHHLNRTIENEKSFEQLFPLITPEFADDQTKQFGDLLTANRIGTLDDGSTYSLSDQEIKIEIINAENFYKELQKQLLIKQISLLSGNAPDANNGAISNHPLTQKLALFLKERSLQILNPEDTPGTAAEFVTCKDEDCKTPVQTKGFLPVYKYDIGIRKLALDLIMPHKYFPTGRRGESPSWGLQEFKEMRTSWAVNLAKVTQVSIYDLAPASMQKDPAAQDYVYEINYFNEK